MLKTHIRYNSVYLFQTNHLMLNFFRRTRRKLSDTDQFTKYSKYAIGEILLVVIGILLALQVNNWNEERKTKIKINSLLMEMIVNLKSDFGSLEYEFERHNEAMASCEIILKVFNGDGAYNDTLAKHFAAINNYTVFKFNKGAYQSLKSIGIETLLNRTLSSHIIDLYDKWYEIYAQNQSSFREDILSSKRDFYKDKFLKFHVFTIERDNFKYLGNMAPVNFDDLKHNLEFIYWIRTLKHNHEGLIWHNRINAVKNTKLRLEIQNEIENLE